MNAGTGTRIDIGAEVVTTAGEKIGTVSYLIIDPARYHLTHLVVGTGALLGRDVVVPIDQVEQAANDRVVLAGGKDELERLPDYVEVNYQAPPAGWAPPGDMAYPTVGLLWPNEGYYFNPATVHVNTPEGTVGLREGMEVVSSDDHKVGSIKAIETDEQDNLRGLVIEQGHIFTHDTEIPRDAIARLEADRVVLRVSRDEVKQRYQTETDAEQVPLT